MDLPDAEETFTLIKSETNESGDTDLQDASNDNCALVSSFDYESLQITKIKEEVNADDCSLMMSNEKETEPDYISTVHTVYRDEPHMDDQPDNTLSFINKCIKSESSEHIVHHHTNMDMTTETASVVIDSEFSNSTTCQCHINIDTTKAEVSKLSTHSYSKLNHASDNLCPIVQNSHLNQYKLTDAEKKNLYNAKFAQTSSLSQHVLANCVDCDKNCTQTGGLDQHMLASTREKTYDCQECCESFEKRHNLRFILPRPLGQHMLTHTGKKQHACPDCDKSFTRTSELKRHMLIHTGEKEHVCQVCDKEFARAGDLKQHMLTHTGEKRHACPDCNKRFARTFQLKRHMLIHTGEKEHVCQVCDKEFARAGDLKQHMLTHTGEKQHVCPECDKRFIQVGYLKRHMLIHTGEKQHACPDCDKEFLRPFQLKRHMLTHTG